MKTTVLLFYIHLETRIVSVDLLRLRVHDLMRGASIDRSAPLNFDASLTHWPRYREHDGEEREEERRRGGFAEERAERAKKGRARK